MKRKSQNWFLKKFDIFGKDVKIRYLGEESYKSVAGGVLSVVSLLIVLAQIGAFLAQLILGTDPQI